MTPDDVIVVQRSWGELRRRRADLLVALSRELAPLTSSDTGAAVRASWLVDVVDELVEILPTPSRLAARARHLGASWPDPLAAPSPATEGSAWLAACGSLVSWSERTSTAWHQAWLLLADVLAAETLSPFADRPETWAP